DAEFRQAYVDRWQELRRDVLSTPNLHAVLDGFLAEFKADDADHPARRDYARWYGSPNSNNIVSETQHLKQWLQNRAAWIDGRFTPQPGISRASGEVTAGETVTITVPGGTVVYYTTDGSD